MLTVKKQRGEDGKQGLLGLKGFGVVTLGVMLGQEKALSSCIPCGQLVRSRASRAAGSQRAAADAPSLNGPAAGRAWRQWWGRDARVPSAHGDEYVSGAAGRCHATRTPAFPCPQLLRRLGKLQFPFGNASSRHKHSSA